MRYLLDTDTLSELLRRAPSPSLIRRLAVTPAGEQCTSSVTLGELLYGAERSPARGRQLAEQIERVLIPNLEVVPFDADAAREYGHLRASLERAGTPIGDSDTRIAAIALTRDLTIVTHNVRHFARVPDLRVEDWLA